MIKLLQNRRKQFEDILSGKIKRRFFKHFFSACRVLNRLSNLLNLLNVSKILQFFKGGIIYVY